MPLARLAFVALLGGALALAGCAPHAIGPGAFTFAVMGDTPYHARQEAAFVRMLERIGAEPDIAFVAHIGDIKGGEACTDALFLRRRAQFDASARPFVYVPGDNEWADCPRHPGAFDALGRLARLREIFFAGRETLGRARFSVDAQDTCLAPPVPQCGCAAYPENRAWTRSGVQFVTLNVTGSENNVGWGAATDAEARCRGEANRRWLERAVEATEAAHGRALVVMIQANPWWTSKDVFAAFLAQIQASAARLARPVLLVHGDTHQFRFDTPFRDARGDPLPNLQRLETYGSPFVGWARVTVDPGRPGVFSAEPFLEGIHLPR